MTEEIVYVESAPSTPEDTTDLGNFLGMLTEAGQSYNLNYRSDEKMFAVTYATKSPISDNTIRARFFFTASGKLIRNVQTMITPSNIEVGLWTP